MRNRLLFVVFALALTLLFIADVALGSVKIPFPQLLAPDGIFREMLLNFRLPKAVTAVVVGAAISISGLVMQTLFRNPLAGPYVLGVSSGAGLGVAVYVLAGATLPVFLTQSGWGLVLFAVLGAAAVLVLVFSFSLKIKNSVSLLIVGMMFGQIAGSLITILQNISDPDSLKLFVVWTFGDLSAVTWRYMQVLLPMVLLGVGLVFFIVKELNCFLLGENYAKSLGVSTAKIRLIIILATALLSGGVTAFTGPIAFLGIAVPHLVRGLWRTADHRLLLPACALVGATLLLLCDLLCLLPFPAYALPINAVSALIGAPVIIWIILKNRRV